MAASGKDEPENDSAVTRRRKLYSNHSHSLLPRFDLRGSQFLMDDFKRDLFIALDPPGLPSDNCELRHRKIGFGPRGASSRKT